MPSPAEQPYGSRPWWNVPLPPEDDEPAPEPAADQAAPPVTPPRATPPSAPGRTPPHATPPTAPQAPPLTAQTTAASAAPTAAGPVVGPTDDTIVMAPLTDATCEMPPVPAAGPGAQPPHPPGARRRRRSAPDATTTLTSTTTAPPAAAPTAGPGSPATPGGPAVPLLSGARLRALLDKLPGADGDPRARRAGLGAAALVALLVLAGSGLLLSRLGGDDAPAPVGPQPTAVAPSTVKGSASSVQRRDGSITYDVGNTLDGDLTTAWNSDSEKDGRGPGITVTYRFAQPVDLRSITIRNGYQKVRAKDGFDLWASNSRVRRFTVTTDQGIWSWNLDDVKGPQTLRQTFGRTGTVRLEIEKVYRGKDYDDVAISEIAFTAVP